MQPSKTVYSIGSTAKIYSKSRPKHLQEHPDRLFAYHSRTNAGKPALVLDICCGSGQFTSLIAPHCERVIAIDSSEAQIAEAKDLPNVTFRVGSAYDFGPDIADESVDIVTIAVALHHVETEKFFKEVKRCLKPGGTLYIMSYYPSDLPEELGPKASEIHRELLFESFKPFWPFDVNQLWKKYDNIELPFGNVERYECDQCLEYAPESLIDLYRSFSSYVNYQVANPDDGEAVFEPLRDEIVASLTRLGKDSFTFTFVNFGILSRKPST